jgi:sugar/nucleoside kinase (ribokinase family)
VSYDVFGMCNPLYDIQAEISDEILKTTGYDKGGMCLIDEEQQQSLVTAIYEHIVNAEPGGSGANTMIGIAQLGGRASFTGKLAQDEHGALYSQGLADKGVLFGAKPGSGVTGISVVLITPDAERTMCTFLGASRELSPDDIDVDVLAASKYIYVTGYLWDTDSQKAAVLHAMHTAKKRGVKVSLSLSDPFCVGRHKAEFQQIISDHVDLLFGNSDEMQELTNTSNPRDAILATEQVCDMAAITCGAAGSLIRQGSQIVEVPSYSVKPVDTTGAGDMYAAGILYGITAGMPLDKTGRIASYLAAEVVSTLGPRLKTIDSKAVQDL